MKNDIKFPLLGSLEEGETFEYILWSIHEDYIEIAILNWLVSRVSLNINDKVDLYIPQILSDEYQFRKNVSGIVSSMTLHEEMQGKIYRVNVEKLQKHCSSEDFAQELPLEVPPVELLKQLIKDSMLLKQGIEVYIKHIIPYFSRIRSYATQEYLLIKQHFLLDVENHIKINVNKLKMLFDLLENKLKITDEIPIYIDLEELREMFESEISAGLFQLVFSENGGKIPFYKDKNYGVTMYISAIKNLEKRLYSNYNQIVLLYLKSLKFLSNQP